MVKRGENPGLLVVYAQCDVNFCRAHARLLGWLCALRSPIGDVRNRPYTRGDLAHQSQHNR